ncbi:MAG: DUF2231 domain-containing protein [Aquificaceae bacterium]|nr:DUF2231 domain-containing protein [Aquificaceae bacterium]
MAIELIKLHPPLVHFGLALPFGLLVLEIYYRLKRKEPDGLHLIFSLLASLSVIGATLSGMIAYEPIEEKLYRIEAFKTHKYMGLFMGLYFALLLSVRLGMSRYGLLRNLFSLLLFVGVLLLLIQGSLGGSVVYDHMVRPWIEQPENY